MSFLVYAFTAGALATLNPCGFAMLPAVLGRFLARGQGGARAGVVLGLLLSLGALTAFGGMGLLLTLVGTALSRYLPYVNLLLGLFLLILGTFTLAGRGVGLGVDLRAPEGRGWGEFYLFGLLYGLASLGCTLPVFLAVAGVALSRGPLEGLFALSAYGLGMGAVLTGASLLVGLGKEELLKGLRRAGLYLEPLGAGLLLLAGGYLLAYWLTFLSGSPGLARTVGLLVGILALWLGFWLKRRATRQGAEA
ncbi:cytochrome c biogenesis CcdA family protein [Thermus sp. FJN-A]